MTEREKCAIVCKIAKKQKKRGKEYGKEEKAYKTCYRGVKKAYPQSNSIFKEGYGHLWTFNVFY